MRSLLFLGAISIVAGCNREFPGTEDHIRLDWQEGDSFHLAVRELQGADKGEISAVGLDGDAAPDFGAHWGEELVWTYQVVETGIVPGKNDELYPFAQRTLGDTAALTVIKASVDPSLNDDESVIAADPVVYLVFQEGRDRLVGVASFWNDGDARVSERSYATTRSGRSVSVLSQSRLSLAPSYLAPFSARWVAEDRTLEDGSVLSTVAADGGVDVFYDDAMSGELVVSRYEDGQPWPTWTMTDSMEIRLLDASEVSGRSSRRAHAMRDTPDDYDYRAALSSSIDIDAATSLSEEDIDAEGFSTEVYEEFRPWAGSWWPLKDGDLVFGYDDRDTFSDRLRDDIDPLKKDMDKLSEEMRGMDDGDEKDAKVEEYRAKQSELVEELVGFYGGVLSDFDGGKLQVDGGQLTHTDGWSYDIESLSPMDKMAVALYLDGQTANNPFYLPAWEILNSYNPGGGSWWGHCNGWAAAAILTNEPRETKTVTIDGTDIAFTTADQKGLLTESHYSTWSHFYGARYYKEGDDLSDLNPAAFQRLISFYIREQGVPLVFDTTATDAVWNFPAWAADLAIDETTEDDGASRLNVNTATLAQLEKLDGIGDKAENIIERREEYGPFQSIDELTEVSGISAGDVDDARNTVTVTPQERSFYVLAEVTFTSDAVGETHLDGDRPESFTEIWGYTLYTDADGRILRGVWDDDSSHPDFAWVPYDNPSSASSGSSENPFLSYNSLKGFLGEELERH